MSGLKRAFRHGTAPHPRLWPVVELRILRRKVASRRVTDFITQRLDPIGQWGLIPYFNFRSQSEQAALKEEVFG